MQSQPFRHSHAAHCESGVMSSLLRHQGLDLSEAMVFGLSSALIFVHMPWVKVGGVPLTAYRMLPGAIIRGLQKSLGVRMRTHRYGNAAEAMRDLDRLLAERGAVGMQTSVYWLPYFPPDMRFHFNAHNLIVYGKDGDEYLISDPVFEHPQRCRGEDLAKARFVKGPFAPKGLVYYPVALPSRVDLGSAARAAIKRTARRMLMAPLPFVGVRGIRLMAKGVEQLPDKHPDLRYPRTYVASVVRMQEEIGTGGAGFRFMFASFLQEAAELTGREALREASELMTDAGDSWREFALGAARLYKRQDAADFPRLAEQLRVCADKEERVFRLLLRAV